MLTLSVILEKMIQFYNKCVLIIRIKILFIPFIFQLLRRLYEPVSAI